MFDLDSLHTAFEKVEENHGCAGIDGITVEKYKKDLEQNLRTLQNELINKTYSPLPLIKILVDKGNGETRSLSIPTVKDRTAQTCVLHRIEPFLDKEFEDCSYAYRKDHSIRQVVYKIKEYYEKGYCWVVSADIDEFFESVNHDLLLKKVNNYIHDPYLRTLTESWIKAEVWDGTSLKVKTQGIPQGSPISPVMANLFLDEFDEGLLKKGYMLIRYADDFIILCKKLMDAEKGLQLSKDMLDGLLLTLDKEDIITFDQGFKYLGVIFLRSLIMTPFDKPKKDHKVVYYPKPFNLQVYLLKKKMGW